jgi:glycogen(starch) synthase
MKILMTADAAGGVWTYALELARALGPAAAPERVELTLAMIGPQPSDEQREEARAIAGVDLRESDWKLEWMPGSAEDVAHAGDWLLALERETQPDIIHLNGYAHGALPWRAPVLIVAHSCVFSWWEAVHGCTPPPEWNWYKAAVTRGLQEADFIVAPSHAMLAAIERHYGHLGARAVISNARDPDLFTGVCPKEPRIFLAGRLWDEAKNVGAVARAAPRLSWPVFVAGEHRMDRETAPGCVRYLGKLPAPEMRSWFGRTSIYALPARYEPFGLSVLEAALSRCALVLGDIPSLRENWDGAAVFVDPADEDALAAAIELLIRNESVRLKLAEAAVARARQFTPERMAGSYLAHYRRLANAWHNCSGWQAQGKAKGK